MGESRVRVYEREELLALGLSILKTQPKVPPETWKAIGNIGIRVTKSTQRGKRGGRTNLEPRKTPVESAKTRPLITINVNC